MTDDNKSQSNSADNAGETVSGGEKNSDAEANKTLGAMSYVFILFLVPLLGKRDSKFAQFHAKQGLVLFAVELLVSMFIWVPLLGQLAMLALLIISVMGIVKALNGEWWEIPYIYEWSKKINL
ncbi:MAG: hypothetical protein WC745_00530 [Patescibacteria group bacterium]|jgi:uncharacterized membrane protein